MKIGSKLAIKRLKTFTTKEGKKFYNATLVEATLNSKIMKGNKWEYNLYLANIYTDLELEEAKYDLELPEKKIEYFTPEGEKKEFFVKANKLDPARISNPDHSIIRVLDFEFKSTTVQENGKVKTNENGKIIFNHTLSIGKCEYDIDGWKLPDKKLELRVATIEKQKQAMSEKYKAIIKDLKAQLKNSNSTESNEENYVEEVAELEMQSSKIYFEINGVEFELEDKEQFSNSMNFVVDLSEYKKLNSLDNSQVKVNLIYGEEIRNSKNYALIIGNTEKDDKYAVSFEEVAEV